MAVDQNGVAEGTRILPNHRGPLERRIKDEAEARRAKFETKRKGELRNIYCCYCSLGQGVLQYTTYFDLAASFRGFQYNIS